MSWRKEGNKYRVGDYASYDCGQPVCSITGEILGNQYRTNTSVSALLRGMGVGIFIYSFTLVIPRVMLISQHLHWKGLLWQPKKVHGRELQARALEATLVCMEVVSTGIWVGCRWHLLHQWCGSSSSFVCCLTLFDGFSC